MKPVKKLKYEIPFSFLHLELKNDFILVSNRQGNSFIYKYENKSLKECEEFPFNLDNSYIMKLKNDQLIIYYGNEIKLVNFFYKK